MPAFPSRPGLALALAALLGACDAGRPAPPPAASEEATGLIAPAPSPAPAPIPPAPSDTWHGHIRGSLSAASGGDLAFVIETEPDFRREPGSTPQRYALAGEQVLSVTWIHCTATASPERAPSAGGTLVVDTSVNPPRYTLAVGSLWNTTIHGTCANGSASVPMRVPGRLEAVGTLSADGRTVEGRQDLGALRWEWRFSRQP